jgi:hypothetical protein
MAVGIEVRPPDLIRSGIFIHEILLRVETYR